MAPTADLEFTQGAVGPLKDKRVIDISSDDYADKRGFIVQAATAGHLEYRTLAGDANITEMGLAIGDFVNVCGVPVLCRLVSASSTVTSIVVGYL